MQRRDLAWRVYVGLGLALALGHLLLPDAGSTRPLAFLLIACTGPVAMLVGVRRRPRSWAWTVLLLGTVLMVAGDALWTYYETVADSDPFPSLADALYVPGYPLVAAGLLGLLRERREGSDRPVLIDALIIAVGSGVLSWVFLIAPYVRDAELTFAERAMSVAYPVMGVLLVAVVARLAFAGATLQIDHLLIGAGVTALLVADTHLGYVELTVGYDWHPLPEALWLAMYILLGAAALVPHRAAASADRLPRSPRVERQVPRRRLFVLLVASLVAPGVLAWQGLDGGDVDLVVIAVASALLYVLVLARVFELVRRLEATAAKITRMAATDPLTGLANRRLWKREVAQRLATADRTGNPLSLAMIDLDHFKRYNDTHGHDAGDLLLSACARAWEQVLRPADLLARVGGEEFALALSDCSLREAEEVVGRLRDSMPADETFSAGVALWDRSESAHDLRIRADMALYAAKAAGRDRIVLAAAEHSEVQR